jgi:thiamine-phosphate pyrophosphorylase
VIPPLVVITDWSLGEAALCSKLEAALGAGCPMAVQHRHPEATARAYFEEGTRLKALCDRFGAPLFVSGRLDIALALGTHLHLPARALRPRDVRQALPAGRWISAAVHDEAEAASAAGADLALVSPVFPTRSKPSATALGLEGLARLTARLDCPAWALGGVSVERLAGLKRAAVISAVLEADDPAVAVQRLSAGLR